MSQEKPNSSASHSPGPWSWGAGRGKWVLTDANDKPMVSFSEWSIEPGDMPLIASAPEMLTLLRQLEWADDGICHVCTGLRDAHFSSCRLNALLSKLGRE